MALSDFQKLTSAQLESADTLFLTRAESIAELRSAAGGLVAGKAEVMSPIESDLKQGDLITAVNGIAVASTAELRSELERMSPQDAVVLRIERQGVFQYLSFEMD